ncbi:MAG: hypothetical protein ACFFDN_48880, partial [Candidatus Hodarchaeota archaeon]
MQADSIERILNLFFILAPHSMRIIEINFKITMLFYNKSLRPTEEDQFVSNLCLLVYINSVFN